MWVVPRVDFYTCYQSLVPDAQSTGAGDFLMEKRRLRQWIFASRQEHKILRPVQSNGGNISNKKHGIYADASDTMKFVPRSSNRRNCLDVALGKRQTS